MTNIIAQATKYLAMLFLALVLAGCGAVSQATPTVAPRAATLTVTAPVPTPSTTYPPKPTNTPAPTIDFDLTAYWLTNPPPTPTGTPVFDADGNITWHPQERLISWWDLGGDGVYYYHQNFALFWDGTLMQPGGSHLGAPYVSKLSQDEICKLLNTAQTSGFFEERGEYNFPFSGAGGSSISINGWKSNSSGAQILSSAISGRPYYDTLFCRNCPIPSEETVIRPGLANMYFLLQNYRPETRHVASVEKLHVTFLGSEKPASDKTWPLTSISLAQLWKDCNKDYDCTDSGMIVDGEVAQEIIRKIRNGDVFSEQIFNSFSTQIIYEASWPEVPDVPQDYTLTCNASAGKYSLLPLNRQNKFWYYAPSGKWAAERVEGESKIRVVNLSGYEKFYTYDPQLFGRETIQVYPRFWSGDDQFFYVNVLPGEYTPNASFVNSIGLQQIDAKNEKVKYIFIGTQGQNFAYTFSSNGKQIAYIRQGDKPLKLTIVDTFSADEKSAYISSPTIPDDQYIAAGSIIWSLDEDKFYLAATYEQDGRRKTHIFMVDSTNPARMKIVYSNDHELKLVEHWSSANICPIYTNADTYCQTTLDLETGEIQN